MGSPIIYNLFPRLVGHMGRWPAHAGRAREMGFDWIFINPIQYPGFSGSLYAVKDFYRLNPLFIPEGTPDPMGLLAGTIDALHDRGLKVMLDLVINHTAKDSELTRSHLEWYRRSSTGEVVSPSAIDPADARKVTVWGDLAEVDNANATDRQGLWAYWTALMQYYLKLGVDGWRCDAAYKVPRALWEQLIGQARKDHPGVVFAAETLGCRLAEVRALAGAGFDYLFNSAKWWNFDEPWCLEQHEEFQEIAPSIAFPESHDTPRLMEESGGLLAAQRQRYAFTAFFSAGVLMPLGYEFGFARRLNVVQTMPEHWEETGVDLSPVIREVNRLKRAIPVLGVEGHWRVLDSLGGPTLTLLKTGDGLEPVVLVVNKDLLQAQTSPLPPLGQVLPGQRPGLLRPFRAEVTASPLPDGPLALDPAEVVLIVPSP